MLCLSLQMDSDTVTASVRSRSRARPALPSRPILAWTNLFPAYVHHVFFWLRQLRRVRRSLNDESVKTLFHGFVTARVDYCNMVGYLPAQQTTTIRVLNAAARLVSGTCQYDYDWSPQDVIRPWTVADFTCRLALARCGRSGPVQAWCYSPPICLLHMHV